MEKEIFEIGDKVYCFIYGWGVVKKIYNGIDYPIYVKFNGNVKKSYTCDGRLTKKQKPTLSFTEYKLQGFSQKRPFLLPNVGEMCLVRDFDSESWKLRFFASHDENGFNVFTENDNLFSFKQCKKIKIVD